MSNRSTLETLNHALNALLDLDEEGWVEAWGRFAVFKLDRPAKALFADTPAANAPPKAYLLMTRIDEDGERFHELWWNYDPEASSETWPVVELSEHGDVNVLAANAEDWLDMLLFTHGTLCGGTEEELESAAEEASHAARTLSDELSDELDRAAPHLTRLAERWEAAVDQFLDPWSDAVEGIED